MGYGFRDRRDAGQRLAAHLNAYAGQADVLVLGLARGGMPVAYEVAQALQAPLDVLVVRKLGVPGHEELAMGAIAPGGVQVLNDAVIEDFGIPERIVSAVAAREQHELLRRERIYRAGRPPATIEGQTVIVVDDGLATGTTMRAAIVALRKHHPRRLIVAAPVIARESCATFGALADALIWLLAPEPFLAVGHWYGNFAPTSDAEVCDVLDRAQTLPPDATYARSSGAHAPASLGHGEPVES